MTRIGAFTLKPGFYMPYILVSCIIMENGAFQAAEFRHLSDSRYWRSA